ncbi:MAG: C25 family cysteine peptidase [Flavobacteriales bacterium]
METDKLILSNKSALTAKYGKQLTEVERAVKEMIAADKKRGIVSKFIYLDGATALKKMKVPAVKSANSATQVKATIDALSKKYTPDYLLLIGSVDVIPHCELKNLIPDDDDEIVPSDLPYACEKKYSTKISDFLSPTRVIGRLPDITGGSDAKYLAGLIRNAIKAQTKNLNEYKSVFALSAKVWKGSTTQSLINIVGDAKTMKLIPPKGKHTRAQLQRKTHFINCHGAQVDSKFYGQQGESYPQALHARELDGNISFGCVVAAECCYGAELFDPEYTDGDLNVSNTYMREGALGFLGSTTVAYGPAEGQGEADLLTQYFIRNVHKGFSLGRSLLDARLRYVEKALPRIEPTELKTIAQFILLGDPSVHLVKPSVATEAAASKHFTEGTTRLMRKDRRQGLKIRGENVERYAQKPHEQRPKALAKSIQSVLKEHGINNAAVASFNYSKTISGKAKSSKGASCHLFLQREESQKQLIPQTTLLVIKDVGGEVVEVKRLERR